VVTRSGLRILPDTVATSWPGERVLPPIGNRPPAQALEDALQAIGSRYGSRTADVVTMQLEYPRPLRSP
jgi:hypothetical protein